MNQQQSKLTQKENEIYILIIEQNMLQKDIAKLLEVSKPAICEIVKRLRDKIDLPLLFECPRCHKYYTKLGQHLALSNCGKGDN